jgi:hypothetical protein
MRKPGESRAFSLWIRGVSALSDERSALVAMLVMFARAIYCWRCRCGEIDRLASSVSHFGLCKSSSFRQKPESVLIFATSVIPANAGT